MRRARGFTFLEIMIVIVILAVMIAMVLPSMSGPRERQGLRTATASIASGGLLARQIAIAEGKPTVLVVSPADSTWRLDLSAEGPGDLIEERRRRRDRDPGGARDEERVRELPSLIKFQSARQHEEEVDLGVDEIRLVFFPNGSSTGLAVEVSSKSDRSMTVDFDRVTGKPEIYAGAPKSFAKKLREMGLDPALFGYADDPGDAASGPQPGDGYRRTAGWSEEERVDYYKDAAQRIMDRARARDAIARDGAEAYYSGAQRWGN